MISPWLDPHRRRSQNNRAEKKEKRFWLWPSSFHARHMKKPRCSGGAFSLALVQMHQPITATCHNERSRDSPQQKYGHGCSPRFTDLLVVALVDDDLAVGIPALLLDHDR